MNLGKQNLAKKTTAFLSAIAASSLLGLPALAQNSPSPNTVKGYPYSNTDKGGYGGSAPQSQTDAGSNQYSAECVPVNQASAGQSSTDQSSMMQSNSAQSGTPASTLGPAADASQPGVRSFPNQTDPRAGSTLPTTNQGMSETSQGMSTNNQSSVGGPVESQSNAQTIDYSSRSQAYNGQSSSSNYNSNSRYNRYGDVLSFGGSTNGGHSREIVEAAADRNSDNPTMFMSSYSLIGNRADKMQNDSGSYTSSSMDNSNMGSSSMSSNSTTSSTTADTRVSGDCGPGMMRRQSNTNSNQLQNQNPNPSNSGTSGQENFQPQNTPAQPGDRQAPTDSDRGGNAR